MRIVCINPNLVVQSNDPLTTGIVYMPITLAYAAAILRDKGHEVCVIDSYARRPQQARCEGKFLIFGLTAHETLMAAPHDAKVFIIYAINLTNHISTLSFVSQIRKGIPDSIIIVLENTQAVTAYALRTVAQEFYEAGADYILTGEPEERILKVAECLVKSDFECLKLIDGVGGKDFYNPPVRFIDNLDEIPYPAWDLFPLEQYWRLGFAHGPLSAKRYLPLLTSRGCPYPCRFCVVPATNNQRWRARSARNVADEIEYFIKTFDVHEFHIEDLDPTISDERIREICREIIDRKLNVVWKISAGTKVETIKDETTIDLMAKAGCRYISISPETGSPRILKLMQKPFDLNHAVRLIEHMNLRHIRSQACFVLGFPGETAEDRQLTLQLAKNLTKKGVDEIALFIVTPVPGSAISGQLSGYKSLSDLNFTPVWRSDYPELIRFRLRLYILFLLWKVWFYPLKMGQHIINFLKRRFETKMEMVPYRAMVLRWWAFRAK